MKKIDLGILDNADDDIIEKLPLFSSDEETRKRVLSMSEKKFDELMKEENKGNDYAESVSGVEKYRRPVWHKALSVAAAIALLAGGIGTAAALKHKSPKSNDSMFAALPTEAKSTSVAYTAAVTEPQVQSNAPVIDITGDTVRFMAPAYAPYLLDISAEQQQKLAAALDSSEWTSCDANEPLPDGEAYTMYAYNNGAPYSLKLYGDNTAKIEGMGETTRWYVSAEAAKAITEAACPSDENVLSGHLTWCDASTINVSDIWKNTRAGAKKCDMTSKEEVFFKMNNTLDYFDRISGIVKIGRVDYSASGSFGDFKKYDFQADLNTAKAYQHDENYYGPGYEAFLNGEGLTNQNADYIYSQDGENSYSVSLSENNYYTIPEVKHRIDSQTVPFEELHSNDDSLNKYDCWNTRSQMLGGIAVECIENYRTAIDYLGDFNDWDIAGTEEVNGRVCVHIKGIYESEQDNIKNFDLYLDKETGVTVRLLSYDGSGNVVYFIEVEDLCFDDDAEQVKEPDLTGMKVIILSDPLIIETDNGTKVVVNTSSDDEIPQAENQEVGPVIEIQAEAKG